MDPSTIVIGSYPLYSALFHRYVNMISTWQQGASGESWLVHGAVAISDIPPKLMLESNLAKYRWSITSSAVVLSFWNFAQSTTVPLPCSVRNFKAIGQMNNRYCANEIWRDLSFRWVRGGGGVIYITTASAFCGTIHFVFVYKMTCVSNTSIIYLETNGSIIPEHHRVVIYGYE